MGVTWAGVGRPLLGVTWPEMVRDALRNESELNIGEVEAAAVQKLKEEDYQSMPVRDRLALLLGLTRLTNNSEVGLGSRLAKSPTSPIFHFPPLCYGWSVVNFPACRLAFLRAWACLYVIAFFFFFHLFILCLSTCVSLHKCNVCTSCDFAHVERCTSYVVPRV